MRYACIEGRQTMLGDILAKLTDEAGAVETILGAGDLTLLTAVQKQAAVDGTDLATCLVQTVQRYTNEANDEEWVTLMGQMNRALDPGAICLKRAFAHALRE